MRRSLRAGRRRQTAGKSKSPPRVPIVIQDDSLPTGPPPQIRILKRPTSNGVVSSPNSTSRPALPVKSLAQREAEYAEARKRILGSASPEEEQEKPILDRPTRISQPEESRLQTAQINMGKKGCHCCCHQRLLGRLLWVALPWQTAGLEQRERPDLLAL
ncbi:PREDICTED: SUZ domain-containing protein 1 isoform X1 [Elephantulus edwardii]|uniref:SUZ domain-containing protein 1 isoform X1 n=1 Tax=Elephantulus edwardii TaxID=28737 RepID=UPI0003F08BE5|nr:PREDICTED: SUZ domain-containing protein 1 isoform X1 [Elephantulus edwardii]